MRFNRLDLNLLGGLNVLLRERSITRAARRLHITQSAASGVLARLREHFGDEILTTVGKTMVLTPFGESLIDPVAALITQIQSTIELKPEIVPETAKRTIKIIASDYVSTILLSDFGRRLNKHAPDIRFEVVPPEMSYIEEFQAGAIDLLIMLREYCVPTMPSCSLHTDSYVCIADRNSDRIDDTMDLDKYMSLGHVSSRFGNNAETTYEEQFLLSQGYKRRLDVVTSNFSTIPYFVIGTDRIATVHQKLAERYAEYFPIRILPCPVDIPPVDIRMQWHQFSENDVVHSWVRQLIVQCVLEQFNSVAATELSTARTPDAVPIPELVQPIA
jgi:DNA-binding transcriptional LysR family regulator